MRLTSSARRPRARPALPLAEHDLLAGWLREQAGLPERPGVATAAVLDREGTAYDVPRASSADQLVVLVPSSDVLHVVDVPAAQARISSGHNLAGEPREVVHVDVSAPGGRSVGRPPGGP